MKAFNPRQLKFIEYWVNPKSETFGNAYASAIKAGFTDLYARTLTSRTSAWMGEANTRLARIAEKAVNNLDTLLDSEDERVKADMTKFTLPRLKKDDFSDRIEHTGKDGKDLIPIPLLNGKSNGKNNDGNE